MSRDLPIQEVATRLGVAARTVRKYIQEGRLPNAYQVNPRLWMVPEKDLEGFQKPLMGNPKRRKDKPRD